MTAVTGVASDAIATRPARLPSVGPLARQETRRLLRHPVTLLGWLAFVPLALTNVAVDHGPRSAYENVDTLLTFYPGVMLILAGHLVASRDRRAGSDELLAALPVRADVRTTALLLAAAAPAVPGLLAVVAIHLAQLGLDRYEVSPSAGALLQGPLTLVGAVLLGVMVARWFRARVAIVLVVVGIVAVNVWLNNDEDLHHLGPMMGWARWGLFPDSWGGLHAGSPGWRVGYLVGLCALAGLGAMLPVVRHRQRVVLAGVIVLAATVACASWTLP